MSVSISSLITAGPVSGGRLSVRDRDHHVYQLTTEFPFNRIMSAVITQTHSTDANSRGRGRRRNSNKKALGGVNADTTIVEQAPQSTISGDSDVCWICAEPVKYYSLSECNHRTCHICAIRLRALYKKTDCTFCKVIARVECNLWAQLIFIFLGSSECGYLHRFARCPVLVLHSRDYAIQGSQAFSLL